VREPNPDRYLAACEGRDADRRLSDEDQDRLSRRNDAYVKMLNCPVYQRAMSGMPVDDDDDPEMADDDDYRMTRLDRLATDAEARADEDRDREMEERG
jgi:hypothetical protein